MNENFRLELNGVILIKKHILEAEILTSGVNPYTYMLMKTIS